MKGREGGENTWSAFSSKLVEVTLFSRDEDFDTLQYSDTSGISTVSVRYSDIKHLNTLWFLLGIIETMLNYYDYLLWFP